MQNRGKKLMLMILLFLISFSTTTELSGQASDRLSANINALLAQDKIARLGAGQRLGDPEKASNNAFTVKCFAT
jgi:hypothetical protein